MRLSISRTAWCKQSLFIVAMAGISLIGFAPSVRADQASSTGAATQEALKKTQDLLRDASARQQAIKGNAAAEQADAKVKALAGENSQAIYDLSAEVMSTLVNNASGDPAKMQELLNKALENPSAFAAQLPEAQRSKLRSIASKIESKQPALPKPK